MNVSMSRICDVSRAADHVVRFARPSLLAQFLHTASDQKPELGKAWERGYSKPYVKLAEGCLILASSVTEFNEVYTILGQNCLYTYKTYETRLRDSVHNSRKNQLYTYLACDKRPSRFYVL